MVGVSQLIDPRLRVEIEVDAVAGCGGCDAVILAGGKGRRMGRDKQSIRLGGRTLLAHAKAASIGAGWKPRVVAVDRQPGLGPLGNRDRTATSSHSRVLFVSCDMPFLTGELLTRFLVQPWPIRGRCSQRQGRGLSVLLRRDDLKIVERQIAKDALSLQRLAKCLAAGHGNRRPNLSLNCLTSTHRTISMKQSAGGGGQSMKSIRCALFLVSCSVHLASAWPGGAARILPAADGDGVSHCRIRGGQAVGQAGE